MYQAYTGFQKPNATQLPNVAQLPTKTPATSKHLRTPLGEPMDQISAEYLAEDPFGWHVEYWNDLFVVGIFRGEDAILMALRIEIEINNIPEKDLATKVDHTWNKFRSQIEEQGRLISSFLGPSYRLEENMLTDEYAKQLFRDVDRMLADKKQKTRAYLLDKKTMMSNYLRCEYT